jgi:hypothetical protein
VPFKISANPFSFFLNPFPSSWPVLFAVQLAKSAVAPCSPWSGSLAPQPACAAAQQHVSAQPAQQCHQPISSLLRPQWLTGRALLSSPPPRRVRARLEPSPTVPLRARLPSLARMPRPTLGLFKAAATSGLCQLKP